MKLQTFVIFVLGQPGSFWGNDVDRLPAESALLALSSGTGVSLPKCEQTTLSNFAGSLWEAYKPIVAMDWLMTTGKKGRRRTAHGQQFCERCLLEDEKPYFRRRWRLSFNVLCEKHGDLLDDACPFCHAPVEFHTGDFGVRLLSYESQITKCGSCKRDLRDIVGMRVARFVPAHLAQFQSELNSALTHGYSLSLPGGGSYSHLFFSGFCRITTLLCSSGRFERARELLQRELGEIPLAIPKGSEWQKFDCMRVWDRAYILGLAQKLLEQWPDNFVRVCKASKVSSSYLLTYPNDLPFWITSEINWHLTDRDYAPCDEEWESVVRYLLSHGQVPSNDAVKRLLGVASTRGALRERWNPRGPNRVALAAG
jgi:hypothetical protein